MHYTSVLHNMIRIVFLKYNIYKLLPVVVYGWETWSLTLREGRRLRVFENRVLRRIFGHKRNDLTREWRKLHNEGLNDLYCSSIMVQMMKSRRMIWAGHVARMGRGEAYTGFWWGNLRERDHFRRPRHTWDSSIKMDLQEVGCGGIDWIELAQDRDRWRVLVTAIMNLWVP